jgi:hypothetical protein
MICFKNFKSKLRQDLADHLKALGKNFKPEDYNYLNAEQYLIK